MIEVDNFRDDPIQVNIVERNPAKDSTPIHGVMDLNAFDVKTYSVSSAGQYQVDFNAQAGTVLGTCLLTVRGGDQFQFVPLPDNIIVNRTNAPPQTGVDLVVATSNACR